MLFVTTYFVLSWLKLEGKQSCKGLHVNAMTHQNPVIVIHHACGACSAFPLPKTHLLSCSSVTLKACAEYTYEHACQRTRLSYAAWSQKQLPQQL